MATSQSGSNDKTESAAVRDHQIKPPSVSLPKGGGAIRGMGEKFAANPVTGTGSLTVPITTSPGRAGFGPQLSLSYDSGAGNGPFGLGWSLSLPSITRKTDKGLPLYRDAEDSDIFILSGAEDLVPVFKKDDTGNWQKDDHGKMIFDEEDRQGYRIRRYRPRIEGLFARIERWTNLVTGDTHWRSISHDNITTLYGEDNNSRIFDPAEQPTEHPTRVFSWLICQSYDDRGNAVIYHYQSEDSQRIFEDEQGHFVPLAHERNRSEASRSANRYPKRIKYGNRLPNRDTSTWKANDPTQLLDDTWMFEVVFDYGEGHYSEDKPDAQGRTFVQGQTTPAAETSWPVRQDPFSTYRAGFEVRTYRLCQRVLMFHHFPGEEKVGQDCLVRATEFSYASGPIASFITSVTQSGFVRQPTQNQANRYLKKSLPSLEFDYSQVPGPEELARQPIREVDTASLENLPIGLDDKSYQWLDLDGEGSSGILTEQAEGWYYKRNLSADNVMVQDGQKHTLARFGPMELVAAKPSSALTAGAQFMDLSGDGQLDLVQMADFGRGFYERTEDAGWNSFQPFDSWPDLNTRDPNLKFVDLTGDGLADILITEDQVLTWYPSLAETGWGAAARVSVPSDEEQGPRIIFADGTETIFLADLSGDGMSDIVRIRNGEVCYWPNLGYGRFGAKVTMDNAPWFENPEQFDLQRLRLADTDGSGTTDILYLGRDGVHLYFNQSGNRWSEAVPLPQFPPGNNVSSVQARDLLGNGTACLVWSSPLPGDVHQPLRYLDLMGGQKPHLLIRSVNNLGAQTRVEYAPSTKFYLRDQLEGRPWITRLPFPVHVVERVISDDLVSRNRFVTRYAYHHGYFDGPEREFRGFGMLEQWDTESFATQETDGLLEETDNLEAASHLPPVLIRTWFHSGAYINREHISDFFAGQGKGAGEYYREPALRGDEALDQAAGALLLPDTVMPPGLSAAGEREACRALKGAMLRQEIYALDETPKAEHPYTVTEQNFTIMPLQPQETNRHAVFFTHPREAISYHYERNPDDPRIGHALTLEVDDYGNVQKSAAIGYGRRKDAPDPEGLLKPEDHEKQRLIHITYTENTFTYPVLDTDDAYRTPLPAETRMFELRKPKQEKSGNELTKLYSFDTVLSHVNQAGDGEHDVEYQDLDFASAKKAAENNPDEAEKYFRRQIEQVRTYYRPDDLGETQNDPLALLEFKKMESLALPGETYKLAFTPGLLSQVFQRPLDAIPPPGAPPPENLLSDPAQVLPTDRAAGKAGDRGGYVDLDGNNHWWIPSGRIFYSPLATDSAVKEWAHAKKHFFLPQRFRDPFHIPANRTETFITYDSHSLFVAKVTDPVGNTVQTRHDYRVLQPELLTDPNGNRIQAAFDALGLVVGTAVMGKAPPAENLGDSLGDFKSDLTQAQVDGFYDVPDPHVPAVDLLKSATTRIIYDLHRFQTTQQANPKDRTKWLPVYAATLARETHATDPLPADGLKIQISFSYADGFGREIQKKIQAEPGPLDPDDQASPFADPRWVGSGWTIFNNKGKPVRQYEPFFDDTHVFKFGHKIGVSPILFYDPVERVVATLNPDHTYEKVVFDPWQQKTYDANDTVKLDPRTDGDISGYVANYFTEIASQPDPWKTWLQQWGVDPNNPPVDQSNLDPEIKAAIRTLPHADTPAVVHLDSLGRTFLTLADNGADGTYHTRLELDIEGNQRQIIDAKDRLVMTYHYDMLGHRIHQASMEAGERWLLNDVDGKPIRRWDSRNQAFRFVYDSLRRPLGSYVKAQGAAGETLYEKTVYGEGQPDDSRLNLRTRIFHHYDGAGRISNVHYDFKGNLLAVQRQLVKDYQTAPDWNIIPDPEVAPQSWEPETFRSTTSYDALNRPVQLVAPHDIHVGMVKTDIIQPRYNEANLLERLDVWLKHAGEPAQLFDVSTADMPAVKDIDYNAKGQRLYIEYGNGVKTAYGYDRLTFRLIRLFTTRGSRFPADCGNPAPCADPPQDCPVPPPFPCGLQNLHYTYDPVGNIVHIRDDAQHTVYFNNAVVEPGNSYLYDALYRLIGAAGREHQGQVASPQSSWNDEFRTNLPHPGNAQTMRPYLERYTYDEVGNIKEMLHSLGNLAAPGQTLWRRTYDYQEFSLLEPNAFKNNRLSRTTVSGDNIATAVEPYAHDAHGNMTSMPHLPELTWDWEDQLQMIDRAGGGKAFYQYEAGGQRLRKVIVSQNGVRQKERLYLGGLEIYREFNGNGSNVKLEREALHLMDDKQRVALVETRILGNDPSPEQLSRYQLGNHLGSASLELDHHAQIISYEEYYPYGSTSYQAVRKDVEVPLKRYRYTGKERDEETGLNYHGARYYAPWLGRWNSIDPEMHVLLNWCPYCYSFTNPSRFNDPNGRSPATPQPDPAEVTRLIDALQRHRSSVGSSRSELQSQERILEGASRQQITMIERGGLRELRQTYRQTLEKAHKTLERARRILEQLPSENPYRSPSLKEPLESAIKALEHMLSPSPRNRGGGSGSPPLPPGRLPSAGGPRGGSSGETLTERGASSSNRYARSAEPPVTHPGRMASEITSPGTEGVGIGKPSGLARGVGTAADILFVAEILAETSGISEFSGKQAFLKGPGIFSVRLGYQMKKDLEKVPGLILGGLKWIWRVTTPPGPNTAGYHWRMDAGVPRSLREVPSDLSK